MVDERHVRHLAHLARLQLTDEEARDLAAEMTRILASFEDLPEGAADADVAPPEDDARADEVAPAPPGQVDAILAEVPQTRDRYVVAPRGGT